MASSTRGRLVLAVVGTTGVGKSKLAVQLAQALGGQVLNTDSMQVYRGLDLATNKPSPAERALVPHHLFDFVDPAREYSVAEYARDAQLAIDAIHAQNQIPVLVGGTHYYMQSLLWNQSIIHTSPGSGPAIQDIPSASKSMHPSLPSILPPDTIASMASALSSTDPRTQPPQAIAAFQDSSVLFDLLARVDPGMAERWHPKDSRKIRRSIEVLYTTGKQHSQWLREQKTAGQQVDTQLRYRTLVFWLYAPIQSLYPRLDSRVDEMVNSGLFEEMQEMRAMMRAGQVAGVSSSSDGASGFTGVSLASGARDDLYKRGILQAIGFKEFHDYFSALEAASEESAGSKPTQQDIDRLRSQGLEDMKRGTRQYARRQITWIRNKLAPVCLAEHAKGHGAFYLIDAESLDEWDTRIRDVAVGLARRFMDTDEVGQRVVDPRGLSLAARDMISSIQESRSSGGMMPSTLESDEDGGNASDASRDEVDAGSDTGLWSKRTCPVCVDQKTGVPKVLNGRHEWEVHIKTRKHQSATRGRSWKQR
ncbi:IPP transferase-domain-containing protein [Entophlyctis helioformis]|nr:IPP transferase-domain-containing protein [Entophlyctis helioformis]